LRTANESRCLTDGELRALIDRTAFQHADAETLPEHLEQCGHCRTRLAAMEHDITVVAGLVATITPQSDPVDTNAAYRRWRARRAERQIASFDARGVTLMGRLTGVQRRTAVAGLIATILMVVAVAAAPLGTMADDFLNRFRVQQFSAITIPMDLIQSAQAQSSSMSPEMQAQITAALSGLGNFSTTLNQGSFKQGATVADANAHLGGNLSLPSKLGSFDGAQPTVYLGDQGTAQYTLNVDRARTMLQAVGINTAALPDPAQTPTVTFTLTVYPSAAAVYDANGKHLIVAQSESPELAVPSSVDMDLLRDEILRTFQGLSPDIVGQLRNVRDWKHTVIVPVPSDAQTSNVTVQGTTGLSIKASQGSAVLWQKDGILHVVASDADVDVVAIANS
jgi:hypothetical protein